MEFDDLFTVSELIQHDDLTFPLEIIGDDQYWFSGLSDQLNSTPIQPLANSNHSDLLISSDLPTTTMATTTQIISDEERGDPCLSDDVEELEFEIRNAMELEFGNDVAKAPQTLPVSEYPQAAQVSKKKRPRERWTTKEHMQFLEGIKIFGDGNWKSISQHCLPTRTHIQIASHAQKYHLRQHSNLKKRKSIHDEERGDPCLSVNIHPLADSNHSDLPTTTTTATTTQMIISDEERGDSCLSHDVEEFDLFTVSELIQHDDLTFPLEIIGDDQYLFSGLSDQLNSTPIQPLAHSNHSDLLISSDVPTTTTTATTTQIISDEERGDPCLSVNIHPLADSNHSDLATTTQMIISDEERGDSCFSDDVEKFDDLFTVSELIQHDDLTFPLEIIGDDQYWFSGLTDQLNSTPIQPLIADSNHSDLPISSDLPTTTQMIISDEERGDSCLSGDVDELEFEIRNAMELEFANDVAKAPQTLPESEFPQAAQVSKKKRSRERWTTKEHMQFLEGIKIFGDGNWKTISQHCLPTRTHIQIASHAQKFHLRRQSNEKKRKSIHDITTAQVPGVPNLGSINPSNGTPSRVAQSTQQLQQQPLQLGRRL